MGHVAYEMMVSLDGYIARPDGALDWVAIDEELHRAANDHEAAAAVHVYGRRMWEVMRSWATLEEGPETSPVEVEFARIWRAEPKVVVSRSLPAAEGPNTTLFAGDAVDEVRRMRAEISGEISVSGATLTASLLRAGLVDQVRMYVQPAAIGAGTPFLPPSIDLRGLRLLDTRTFRSGVVHLAYEVRPVAS